MPAKLTKVDDLIRPHHRYIQPDDECYYWGEYQVRGGFGATPTNQLITNIKIPVSQRASARYFYKTRDIEAAGATLSGAFRSETIATVVPVPPSKHEGDPEYDDRVVRVAQRMVRGTNSEVRRLVRQTRSYAAAHLGVAAVRIAPHELLEIYEIDDPNDAPRDTVVVLDDMLTQGAHFRAVKTMILRHFPNARVLGLFIARAVDKQFP